MPAILLSRDTRTTVTALSAVAIVVYILIPIVILSLIVATVWLVFRNKKRRKAQALAQAEGSNVHLYSNGYQNTQNVQNTGYYPHGQQLGGANGGGGWVVNSTPAYGGNNTGGGWAPNGSSGPAAPVFRAMPPPADDTEHGASHAGDANSNSAVGPAEGIAPPQAVYSHTSNSTSTSTANLTGNTQPPPAR
ncbi:hypothetical protein GGTG_06395 [Gaeumannomyces tritici R3-111a-1]|uniref:Uncharacterized protein n=1 Tax=Gaeumannomyces tritici (strain R3-111a-1) TaxID=644352 RepID=J3NYP3_GAET3|nr:hypothetical protein GGTG_06395 [Gaeumannomyces tritici R3-111a-1]EJT76476.1 hypothetical protein GGTG_06395 [Gaeumannomyces tritici R3-111a-1]